MELLVELRVDHGARSLTEDGRELEARLLDELAQLVDRVMAVALPAHRPVPQTVAPVGEDVDDDLGLAAGL